MINIKNISITTHRYIYTSSLNLQKLINKWNIKPSPKKRKRPIHPYRTYENMQHKTSHPSTKINTTPLNKIETNLLSSQTNLYGLHIECQSS